MAEAYSRSAVRGVMRCGSSYFKTTFRICAPTASRAKWDDLGNV